MDTNTQLLLREMRHIAGISTGQVKRVAEQALAAAQQAQPEPSEKTWCEYVAGMVGCYLGEPVDGDKCKAIAAIIERRLWALPKPVQQAQPERAPLSDADKRTMYMEAPPSFSNLGAWEWYQQGLEDAEKHHGIKQGGQQ